MMSKNRAFVLLIFFSITAFFIYKYYFKAVVPPREEVIASEVGPIFVPKKSHSDPRASVIDISLSKVRAGKIKKTGFTPQNQAEAGLQKINNKLNEIFSNRESPQELVRYFEQEKLQPEMSERSNEYTGTMIMIRTQRSIPGVRYLHAQYMGDDSEHTFLQHFSYEFRPSSNAVERATQSAEETYSLRNKKVYRDGEFITYDIGDNGEYELSIEKANWESLENDPYNAHAKGDVGAITTRIELKLHDDGDNDHIEVQDHE